MNNPSSHLYDALREARERTLELIQDLDSEQMMGPRLSIINPLLWEIGHVAFFQEFWVLRHSRGRSSLISNGDALYDSARVAHPTRWDLPLPAIKDTLRYMQRVLADVTGGAESGEALSAESAGYTDTYFLWLVLLHEYMHAEAITYTRQTLGYSAPRISIHVANAPREALVDNGENQASADLRIASGGDVAVPGGRFYLGADDDETFAFDNEQWAHPVEVKPFSIARTAVTNAEFAAFVADRGYTRRELWSAAGWQWLEQAKAEHPVYWQPDSNGKWLRRHFSELVLLEDYHPVIHVNWFEAKAYCRWAGRRLPTEAEWEMAASSERATGGSSITTRKRRFPWGDESPTPDRANLDWRSMGCIDVEALPGGDSAWGCRQMVGNVWEWTDDDFNPFPGFSPGPYKEYSAPWFGDHKVLRGGCWATRSRLIRNTYRNFYRPDRRDVWAGFRTCAR
ncbi:MAG TPA: selenoneine synthase SenA [Blastocatellia bacterium]